MVRDGPLEKLGGGGDLWNFSNKQTLACVTFFLMLMVIVQGCNYNKNNAYCNDDESNNVIIMTMKQSLMQFLC